MTKLYSGGPRIELENFKKLNNIYTLPVIGLYNETNYSYMNAVL
jgi:hypothetical protein